ncbi:Trk system potassium transporter TrkA [Pelagibaculum spongiae]|uniref:Trk system potassium uptake protein TrkA n=1 Tax=Pelagibaculum spongiae TaxID=2080658 RepID=A0A2V1H0J2_9GAMM|nr:Trk system potassium transporter TrkA [Pelagibaculum spongiae]PVZ68180.1 Trk system potassium transporter TrkA [Pelagibaculum spongiae]
MKIIILGAGQVGGTLAENLASEANDITVVDTNRKLLQSLQDRLDLRTICGYASHPTTLRKAGAEDADMLIAVTNSDETNMVACQVAYTLYRTPTKIARVRSQQYMTRKELFDERGLAIDYVISPEQLVTNYIRRLIEYPGALQVLDFAGGKVQLVGVKAYYGGPLVGQEIKAIRQHMPSIDTRVAAIFRRDRPIVPHGDTIIEADDEVFFIAARNHIMMVMSELRRLEHPYRRIMIAGGGNIGHRLAHTLEDRYNVKLLERSPERAEALASDLHKTITLIGDAADEELLQQENIEDIDIFCAVTNDDEANIMSSMLAKRMGARKVMALINRTAYVDLVQGGEIDIAISPQQATISALLTHVRRGDVVNVYSLRRGAAEAIEAIAHGDKRSSRVVGRRIDEINLPADTTIGALVRGSKVFIAHDDLVIEQDDHVILFLLDKKHVHEVERLFQVAVTFF